VPEDTLPAATPAPTDPPPAPAARAHRSPFFYGWWIIGSGFTVMTMSGALLGQAFGSYVVLLRDEFGWSSTTFSLAFALQRVESGLLGPVDGWLVDRFGPRVMMTIGLAIFGAGFLLLSQADSITTFYLAFMVLALGGALGTFLPASVAAVNWFARRRSTALAIMMLGIAAGGIVQPVVVAGLEALGWRGMAVLSAVLMFALAVPAGLLLRHRPEPYGWRADGDAAPAERGGTTHLPGDVDFTPQEAMKTGAFWLIGLGHGLGLLVTGAVMVHFAAHVRDGLGYSLGTAAAMVTLMTVLQVAGQMGGGFLGDRVDKRLLIVVAILMTCAGLLVLAVATSLWMVAVFAALNGIGFGARIPLTTAIRADYFGSRHYGTISGFNGMLVTAGIMAGPLIAGASYDVTGSYVTGFTWLALVGMLGAVLFAFVRKPALPARRAQPAAALTPERPS